MSEVTLDVYTNKLLADIIVDNDDILLSAFKAYVANLGITVGQYVIACDKYTEKIMGDETTATITDKVNMRHGLLRGIRMLNPDDVKIPRSGLSDRRFKILMAIFNVHNVNVSILMEGSAYTPGDKDVGRSFVYTNDRMYSTTKFIDSMIRNKKED